MNLLQSLKALVGLYKQPTTSPCEPVEEIPQPVVEETPMDVSEPIITLANKILNFELEYEMKDEVNRILCLKREKKRYRYDDRTNPVKAREMFEIYQSHHNPSKDIDRAIRLHRGLHSPKYVKEVKNKLRK